MPFILVDTHTTINTEHIAKVSWDSSGQNLSAVIYLISSEGAKASAEGEFAMKLWEILHPNETKVATSSNPMFRTGTAQWSR